MKNKTTFRALLIVSAFALLTLPSMFNVNAKAASREPPRGCVGQCYGEFLDCLVNVGDDSCGTQLAVCLAGCH
jgi:hypothetical protein